MRFAEKRFLCLALIVSLGFAACQKDTCPAFETNEKRFSKKAKAKKKLYSKDRDLFGNKR
jgi:hypothetical protein